jgi:hypothetical protein
MKVANANTSASGDSLWMWIVMEFSAANGRAKVGTVKFYSGAIPSTMRDAMAVTIYVSRVLAMLKETARRGG